MNPLSAQMPGPEAKGDSAEMDQVSGAAVVSATDGDRLVRFLKVFRPLECTGCDEVIAFQHKVTKALYCMNQGHGGGDDAGGSKRMPCYMGGMMGGGAAASQPDLKMRNVFHSGRTFTSPIDTQYGHQVATKSRELEDSDSSSKSIPQLVAPPRVVQVQSTVDAVDGALSVAKKPSETVKSYEPTIPRPPKAAPAPAIPEIKPMPKSVAAVAPPPAKETVRRYMWSECVYSPKLAKGEIVILSFTWNATTFLISSEGDAETLQGLQEELMKYAETAKPMSAPPVVGEMVVGKYDDAYYRGRVTAVAGENCKIVFVDYGDQVTCKYSEILPANDDKIMSYPIYGMTVHLEKLPLDPKDVKLSAELENAVCGAYYRLKFCENIEKATPSDDPVEVRLLDNSSKVTLNETIQKSLFPQSVTAAPPPPKTQDPDVPMWSQYRYSPNLTNGVKAYIQYQYSPTCFHVVTDKDCGEMHKFQAVLNESIEKNGKPLTKPPVVDQIVIGRYDGQYYRGRIEKVDGDSCRVVFIDFGDKNTCKYSELFQPDDAIMKYPIFGCMLHLDKVPDPPNPETFRIPHQIELILNDLMILEVEGTQDLVPRPGQYTVEGRLWDYKHNHCVNNGLIKAIQGAR